MDAYAEDRREPRALLYVWPRGRREPARTFVRVYLCRKEARARFQHWALAFEGFDFRLEDAWYRAWRGSSRSPTSASTGHDLRERRPQPAQPTTGSSEVCLGGVPAIACQPDAHAVRLLCQACRRIRAVVFLQSGNLRAGSFGGHGDRRLGHTGSEAGQVLRAAWEEFKALPDDAWERKVLLPVFAFVPLTPLEGQTHTIDNEDMVPTAWVTLCSTLEAPVLAAWLADPEAK